MHHLTHRTTLGRIPTDRPSRLRPARLRGSIGLAVIAALALGACSDSADDPPPAAAPNDDAPPSDPATDDDANNAAPSSVASKGQLVNCVDPTVPPMEFFGEDDSENPIGFDIDMVEAVAESWGVETVQKVTPFTGILPALAGGSCDIVWSAIFILPERLEGEFDAVPYLGSGPVLLVPAGNPEGISSPEDLSGKTVAVQSGTNFPGMILDLNDELTAAGKDPANLQEYSGASDAAQQVLIGRASAFLALDADGTARVNDSPDDWEIGYTYPKDLQYGVFYLKEDTELGEAIQAAVDELVDSGTMKARLEHWGLPTDTIITR